MYSSLPVGTRREILTWRSVQRGEFFLEFQSEGVGYGVVLYLGEDGLPDKRAFEV